VSGAQPPAADDELGLLETAISEEALGPPAADRATLSVTEAQVGVLTPDVREDLQPAFEFGLGWIGFVVGIQLDVHRLDRLPRRLGSVIVAEAIVPMIIAVVFGAAFFAAMTELLVLDRGILRDAMILGACAAPTATVATVFWARRVGERGARLLYEVTLIDEVVALILLGVCMIWFRKNDGGASLLPGSAWLLISAGLGVVLGVLTYGLVRGAASHREEAALLIGAVALSAGMAQQLGLSVPVVCAIAGALLTNLPLRDKRGLRATLEEVERPLYLVFLLVVGAMWRPSEWQGWALAPVFVLARILGKYLGTQLSLRIGPDGLPPPKEATLALMPQSPSAVVLIVAATTLYGLGEERIRWVMTAIIVGGVLTNLVLRVLAGRLPIPADDAPPELPVDLPGDVPDDLQTPRPEVRR